MSDGVQRGLDIRWHVGEEGFLRVAVNNRSEIKDRRVVYGKWRLIGPFRYPFPPRGLKGEKQPRAPPTPEFRGGICTSRAARSLSACQWGHPPLCFASPPGGLVSRSPPRNNIPDSVPSVEGMPSRACRKLSSSPIPIDIITVSKYGFVVVIFTGGRRPGRDKHGEWSRLLTPPPRLDDT